MHPALVALRHQIIVSVQADEGEPLNTPACLLALAQSALNGGAKGLRIAQPNNIEYIRSALPTTPIIGITKPKNKLSEPLNTVYITPTAQDALAVAQAGASIVALDATQRERPEPLEQIIAAVRLHAPHVALMADIATREDAIQAEKLGFDCIGTTLAGYTQQTLAQKNEDEPDFTLLQHVLQSVSCPIILEGRVWEPEHVRRGFALGCHAVVIGSAITRPQVVTQRFVQAITR